MAGGRPNKYETHVKPYFDQIKKALERGVDEKDIAAGLGVSTSAWCEYKLKFKEFAELIKGADRSGIIEQLESALMKRALGYDYEEEKRVGKKDKDGEQIILIEKYKRHLPPDTTAIYGALNRFDPNYKKDAAYYELKKQELELKKAIAEASNFDLDLKELET